MNNIGSSNSGIDLYAPMNSNTNNNIGSSNGGIDLYAPMNSNNNVGGYNTNSYDNTNQQLQLLDNNTNANSINATIIGEIDDNELIMANNNAINNNMGVTGGVVNGVPSMVAVSVSATPDRGLMSGGSGMSGGYRAQQQQQGNGINYNDYYTNNNNNNKSQSQQQLYNNNNGVNNNNMRQRNNNGNYQQQIYDRSSNNNQPRQFPNIKQQQNLAYTTGSVNGNEYYDYAVANNTTATANTTVSADDSVSSDSNNYYTQSL